MGVATRRHTVNHPRGNFDDATTTIALECVVVRPTGFEPVAFSSGG